MTATPQLKSGHYCYTIPHQDPNTYGGYVPSLVIEGESGHYPMLGSGVGALPWIWGTTREQAEAAAARQNASLGLTEERVMEIVASSMRTVGYQEDE